MQNPPAAGVLSSTNVPFHRNSPFHLMNTNRIGERICSIIFFSLSLDVVYIWEKGGRGMMMMRVTWPWRVSTRRPGHVEWKGRVQHTHNDEGEKRGKNNNEAPRLMPLPLPPPACRQQRPSYTTCNVTNPSTPSFLVFTLHGDSI